MGDTHSGQPIAAAAAATTKKPKKPEFFVARGLGSNRRRRPQNYTQCHQSSMKHTRKVENYVSVRVCSFQISVQ